MKTMVGCVSDSLCRCADFFALGIVFLGGFLPPLSQALNQRRSIHHNMLAAISGIEPVSAAMPNVGVRLRLTANL
jgi:hypothetical protein